MTTHRETISSTANKVQYSNFSVVHMFRNISAMHQNSIISASKTHSFLVLTSFISWLQMHQKSTQRPIWWAMMTWTQTESQSKHISKTAICNENIYFMEMSFLHILFNKGEISLILFRFIKIFAAWFDMFLI